MRYTFPILTQVFFFVFLSKTNERTQTKAVNEWLINQCKFDPHKATAIGLVVEIHSHYFKPLAYPDVIETGLFVSKVTNSSIRYECGIFKKNDDVLACHGSFTHVYVDTKTRKYACEAKQI